MTVPESIAAEVLSRCGRCCCICRRFKPIHLQIHHVIERSQGGSDDIDNLIPICLSCHTDVHTRVPFTQRFTVEELKLHRENLYRLVAEGKLPHPADPAFTASLIDSLRRAVPYEGTELAALAQRILTLAVEDDGTVIMLNHSGGTTLQVGRADLLEGAGPRTIAEYRHAMEQLLEQRLIRSRGYKNEIFEVTHEGYLLADELLATAAQDPGMGSSTT